MSRATGRGFSPKVLTAHDLLDGEVVYLAPDGCWTRRFANARLLTEPDSANAELASANAASHTVISAALTDAKLGADGVPFPLHFREVFRMTGPSNLFHGKQADVTQQEQAHV